MRPQPLPEATVQGSRPAAPQLTQIKVRVMALCSSCYSILLAPLMFMAPKEAPEGREQEESSSDYKCFL